MKQTPNPTLNSEDVLLIQSIVNKTEERINDKIDTVERRLRHHAADVEMRLEKKIDTVEAQLSANIDKVETGLTTKIEAVEAQLSAKIDKVNNAQTEQLMDMVETITGTMATEEQVSQVSNRVSILEEKVLTA